MKINYTRFLIISLFGTLLSYGKPAFAASQCSSIFSKIDYLIEAPKGVFNKIKSVEEFSKLRPQIQSLALGLLRENSKIMTMKVALDGVYHKEQLSLELVSLSSKTNYAVVDVRGAKGSHVRIRTNGTFAFLSSTWEYRNAEKVLQHRAVGFVNNRIKVFKQTELILATLPDKNILSRNLSEAERNAWFEGKDFKTPYTQWWGVKVHFAPNHFLFKKDEPYRIEFSKKDLYEFYQRNELEINIYDPVNTDTSNPMQLTPLGIEFEYVFVGKNAVENLRSIMVDGLRQGLLKF